MGTGQTYYCTRYILEICCRETKYIFKRFNKEPYPWTKDIVLKTYKFTNAYRASDRVSQYLIKNIIYNNNFSLEDTFFRIILFKLFNKIETWELLRNELGEISYENYNYEIYNSILTRAMEKKTRIYSAAYIMASGYSTFGQEKKHSNHLKLIEVMMEDELYKKIRDSKNLKEIFELLKSYPTIGNFLAYQLTIDLNYSNLTSFTTESSFVIPGPGALDGIKKCFYSLGGLNEIDIIKLITEKQEIEFKRLNLSFKDLWGRQLQLIDCQNLFCEVDKYSRIVHPNFVGLTGRIRIKQKFKVNNEEINYYYPPKWGIKINKKI